MSIEPKALTPEELMKFATDHIKAQEFIDIGEVKPLGTAEYVHRVRGGLLSHIAHQDDWIAELEQRLQRVQGQLHWYVTAFDNNVEKLKKLEGTPCLPQPINQP